MFETFGLATARLVAAAVYFAFAGRDLPVGLEFDDLALTGETAVADVRRYLEAVGLQARSRVDDEDECLTLDSGSSIVFIDGLLHSVHFHEID